LLHICSERPMARTVRDAKLETRAARARLQPNRKPHWKTLVPGSLHLGYRKKSKAQAGTWLVRRYIGGERYRIAPLGITDDLEDTAVSYEEAQRLAYEHHSEVEDPEPRIDLTVADAIARYVAWMKLNRATGPEVEQRAALHILPQLGNFKVSDLTTHQLNGWRDKLAASPALFRARQGMPHKHKPGPKTKDEQRARKVSANKCVTILKAALNRAFREGLVEDDKAWRRFELFHKVEIARERSLTIAEAQRFIEAADERSGFRDLLRAALLTGCRFGELRNLLVEDFARGKIAIRQSKSGKPRHVRLTEEGSAFFERLAGGRFDQDYLLMNRRLGREWRKSEQNRPMRAACTAAGISPPVGIHQMRHTWASLALMNGVPLLVVATNLGHANTSQVEKNYGHLTSTYMDEAIRHGAPRFDLGRVLINPTPGAEHVRS
jgi:integrase